MTLRADFHLAITKDVELEARKAFQAVAAALVRQGFSVTIDGPEVVAQEPRGPRGLQ